MDTERPAASPADAKAVYDSMVATGGTPTVRTIAAALNASGKFAGDVSFSKVHRWQKQGWTGAKPAPTPEQRAEAKADAVVLPALTGDPTARTADVEKETQGILQRLPEVERFAAELQRQTDVQLISTKMRERLISSILVERMLQARLEQLVETPAVLSVLESGLAGTTGALMIAAEKEQEVRAAAARVIEHEEAEPLMTFVEPAPEDEETA